MFEKKPTGTGFAPTNLPTGGQRPTPAPQPQRSQVPREPEDILEGIDKPLESVAGPAQPTQPVSRPKMSLPPAAPPREKLITKEPFFKQHQKAFIAIVIILVGGAVLTFGGWYGYKLFVSSPAPSGPAANINTAGTINTGGNLNAPLNTNQAEIVNENVPPPPPLDTDRDGLSDEEEAMYGTNKDEVDTDKDGLTDRDEVKVFKTDPNDPDTDGDTYLDGEEVRAGYDPKGPGRLLQIE